MEGMVNMNYYYRYTVQKDLSVEIRVLDDNLHVIWIEVLK